MGKRIRFSFWYYLIVFAVILGLQWLFFSGTADKEISYNEFRDKLANNEIEDAVITEDKITGLLKSAEASTTIHGEDTEEPNGITPSPKTTPWRLEWEEWEKERDRQFQVIRLNDDKLLTELQNHGVDYRGKIKSHFFSNLFSNWILPFGLLFLIWAFLFRRLGGGVAALKFGKNKAKIYAVEPKDRVTFKDVAGIDEAVEEVKEIVGFLKPPNQMTRLRVKLPRGVLLIGPPGTGKTLLAKAVAGEVNVPFFKMSGSDFVEMFVGVGAARVRDLFAAAKAKAPCIIFIDEIDVIGKSRSNGVISARDDERENTFNQLLIEMDGCDPGLGIIIIGASNRGDVLDHALIRPGRFDRQILLDRPDLKGRLDLFLVHTRDLALAKDVELLKLAAQTAGLAGAEIANIVNEAVLLACRKGQSQLGMNDFQEAIDRGIVGLEKKNKLINPRERRIVAYHESGHVLVGHFTPGADPVQKVSIIPRGLSALGHTIQTPLEDRYLMSRSELLVKIKGLLGGRAAEEVVFAEISTGASNDLERATKIARDMIKVYGMSKRIPNVSLTDSKWTESLAEGAATLLHSEKIEQMIDEEILEIINTCYDETKQLLNKKREKLDKMAGTLLENEAIEEKEILTILGPRPETLLKNQRPTISTAKMAQKLSSI